MPYKRSLLSWLIILLFFSPSICAYTEDIGDWKQVHNELLGITFPPNIYLGGAVGFAASNWEEIPLPDDFVDPPRSTEAKTSGFTWGAFGGWHIRRYFGLETGSYIFFSANRSIEGTTTSSATPPVTTPLTVDDDTTSFIVYGAVRGFLPVSDNFALFAKLGPVYRHIGHDIDCFSDDTDTTCSEDVAELDEQNGAYWSVFVSLGFEYEFFTRWAIGAQWFFVPSHDDNDDNDEEFNKNAAPALNAGVAFISYRLLLI